MEVGEGLEEVEEKVEVEEKGVDWGQVDHMKPGLASCIPLIDRKTAGQRGNSRKEDQNLCTKSIWHTLLFCLQTFPTSRSSTCRSI